MRTARALFIAWDNQWRKKLREADRRSAARGGICVAAADAFACSSSTDDADDDSQQQLAAGCCSGGASASKVKTPRVVLSSFRASSRGVIAASAALSLLQHALELAAAMLLREVLLELSGTSSGADTANQMAIGCLLCWLFAQVAERLCASLTAPALACNARTIMHQAILRRHLLLWSDADGSASAASDRDSSFVAALQEAAAAEALAGAGSPAAAGAMHHQPWAVEAAAVSAAACLLFFILGPAGLAGVGAVKVLAFPGSIADLLSSRCSSAAEAAAEEAQQEQFGLFGKTSGAVSADNNGSGADRAAARCRRSSRRLAVAASAARAAATALRRGAVPLAAAAAFAAALSQGGDGVVCTPSGLASSVAPPPAAAAGGGGRRRLLLVTNAGISFACVDAPFRLSAGDLFAVLALLGILHRALSALPLALSAAVRCVLTDLRLTDYFLGGPCGYGTAKEEQEPRQGSRPPPVRVALLAAGGGGLAPPRRRSSGSRRYAAQQDRGGAGGGSSFIVRTTVSPLQQDAETDLSLPKDAQMALRAGHLVAAVSGGALGAASRRALLTRVVLGELASAGGDHMQARVAFEGAAPLLLPGLTIRQNIQLGGAGGWPPREALAWYGVCIARAELHCVFDRLPLGDLTTAADAQLTEEEAQKVALARAAFSRPRLAVLCSPLSASGPEAAQRILAACLARGPLAAVPRLVSLAPNQAHLLHLSSLSVIVRSGGAAAACAPLRDLIGAAIAGAGPAAGAAHSSVPAAPSSQPQQFCGAGGCDEAGYSAAASASPFLRGALAALLLEARGFPWAAPAAAGGRRRLSSVDGDAAEWPEELLTLASRPAPPLARFRLRRSNSAPTVLVCPVTAAAGASSWWPGAAAAPGGTVAPHPALAAVEAQLEISAGEAAAADAWGPSLLAVSSHAATSRAGSVVRTYSCPAVDQPTRRDFLLAYVALSARGSPAGGSQIDAEEGNGEAGARSNQQQAARAAAAAGGRRRRLQEAAKRGGGQENAYALRSSGRLSVSPDPRATAAAAEAARGRIKRALATAGAAAAWAAAQLSLCAASFRLVQVIDSASAADAAADPAAGLPLAIAVLAVGGAGCALGHAFGDFLASLAAAHAAEAAAALARRRALLRVASFAFVGRRLLTAADAAMGGFEEEADAAALAAHCGAQALADRLQTAVAGLVSTGIVCYLCPVLAAAVPPCALLCVLASRLRAARCAGAAEKAEGAREGIDTLTEALSRPDAALTVRAYGAARRVANLAAELLDRERTSVEAVCSLHARGGVTHDLITAAGCAAVIFVAVAAASGGAPWNVGDAHATAMIEHPAAGSTGGGPSYLAAATAGWVIFHGVAGCRALCAAAASSAA